MDCENMEKIIAEKRYWINGMDNKQHIPINDLMDTKMGY